MQKVLGENQIEKWANVITHGVGALLSFGALSFFILNESSFLSFNIQLALFVFAVSLIFVYSASTIYHLSDIYFPKWKTFFKRIDHISIYTLIAGTQTPIIIQYLDKTICLIYLSALWLLVIMGIVYKIYLLGKFQRLSIAIYIGLGWLFIIVLPFMYEIMRSGVLTWIIIGGIAYSGGVIFYVWERLKFNHSIWHICVIIGSVAHFMAVYLAVFE